MSSASPLGWGNKKGACEAAALLFMLLPGTVDVARPSRPGLPGQARKGGLAPRVFFSHSDLEWHEWRMGGGGSEKRQPLPRVEDRGEGQGGGSVASVFVFLCLQNPLIPYWHYRLSDIWGKGEPQLRRSRPGSRPLLWRPGYWLLATGGYFLLPASS
jgi:hypothetical protein